MKERKHPNRLSAIGIGSESNGDFWSMIDSLIKRNGVVIDRPRASQHPRLEGAPYPFDYGYVRNTTAPDGEELDVWICGSAGRGYRCTGVVLTVSVAGLEFEPKLLLGATPADTKEVMRFHEHMGQKTCFVDRVP